MITDQQRKEEVFTEAFEHLLGHASTREADLNLDFLELDRHDLSDLDAILTEEEVWDTIKDMPLDRAPRPDGFIPAFYQKAWPIVKNDLMAVIIKLYVGVGGDLAS